MQIQAGTIHKPAECCCTYSNQIQEMVTAVHTKAATQHKLKDQLSCVKHLLQIKEAFISKIKYNMGNASSHTVKSYNRASSTVITMKHVTNTCPPKTLPSEDGKVD
jgi:hypothetical protein